MQTLATVCSDRCTFNGTNILVYITGVLGFLGFFFHIGAVGAVASAHLFATPDIAGVTLKLPGFLGGIASLIFDLIAAVMCVSFAVSLAIGGPDGLVF